MLIPKLKLNTFTTKIRSKNIVLHIVPELGTDILEHLGVLSISTSNVHSILVRDTVFKIGPKRVNPKAYFNSLKSKLPNTDYSHIRVVKHVSSIPKSSAIIVDHTKTSEALNFIAEKTSTKLALFYAFEQISKEIKNISFELKDSNVEQLIIFSVTKKENGLLDILESLKLVSKEDLSIEYSNIGIGVAVNVTGSHPGLIPLLSVNNLHKTILHASTINKARARLPEELSVDIIDDENLQPADHIIKPVTTKILGIISMENGEYSVDKKQLSTILKRVKIRNKNTEAAISKFIEEQITNAAKENMTLSTSDLEFNVLRAISFSLTGSTDDAVTLEPEQLIARLADTEAYTTTIALPNIKSSGLVDVKDSPVDNTIISGVNRHEFEYKQILDKSVRELFQSLSERPDAPIAVKKITKKDSRDNKNAFNIYTITLQNLNGGEPEPYDVKIKLPAIVNDKYLLLGGNTYMPLTQQFLKPIVKDKKNEVRFITQFNTDTLRIRNIAHTVGDYSTLIEIMESKYPELLTTVTRDDNGSIIHIKFENNSELWTRNSEIIFKSNDKTISSDNGVLSAEYANNEIETINISIAEIIFNEIFAILTEAHPQEAKLSKQEPYIEIYTNGAKIPFIAFLWHKYGLLGALVKTNIDYEIVKKGDPTPENATVNVPLSDGSKVWLIPNSLRENLIANGLPPFYRANKFEIEPNKINDNTVVDEFMRRKFKKRIIEDLNNAAELMVDSTTARVLKKEGLPTDYLQIITGPLLDKLIDGKVEHPNDLKNVRARQSEIITTLIYRELSIAHSRYRQEVKRGNPTVKLNVAEDYVIRLMQGKQKDTNEDSGAAIRWIDPYSPVTELIHASEVIRTGPGGVPNQRSFRPEQRTVHRSSIGNMSAHSTPEYANVGTVTHNCLHVQVDKDGFYGGKVNDTDTDPYGSLSINEALVPFQNQMNSDRLIMAVTHMAQKIPLTNPEVALVSTGAESLVSQLSSSKFIHNAKHDGVVIKLEPNKFITVQYKNGAKETFDINYRKSLISGKTNILLDMNSLQVGVKFKEHQAVAWTENFVGSELATGKNLVMAVMSYLGKNFEDGYSISQDAADGMTTDVLNKFTDVVDRQRTIINITSDINKTFSENTVLIETALTSDIVDGKAERTRKIIVPAGRLIDIKIRLNQKQGVDKVILDLFDKQTKSINRQVKAVGSKLDNIDLSVLTVGGHKNRGKVFDGAMLEFFIAARKGLEPGDKISGRFGTKGVITNIMDQQSKSDFSGNIDLFISPLSIMGRKNTAVIKELYIGKVLFHAPNIFSDLAKTTPIAKVKATLRELYTVLDTSHSKTNIKSVDKKLKGMSDASLKKALIAKTLKFNIIFPPFTNIGFSDIKAAADLLEIPLDEKVFIPELNMWTKELVPVGINYISSMEQLSTDKESTRAQGSRTPVTGQPTRGKSKGGGQSISELDIYAMLNYDTPEILHELMNSRSDNFIASTTLTRDLALTGKATLADLPTGHSDTLNLLHTYMNGMGLATPETS